MASPAIGQFDRLWIDWFGTGENESLRDFAPHGQGGLVAAGYSRGNLGGPNAGGKDLFLALYRTDGQQAWVSQVGTNDHDLGGAVALDGAGGAFLGGYTHDTHGGPYDSIDLYVARFDAEGALEWAVQWGTDRSDQLSAMASDAQGGFYAAGDTTGNLGGPNAGEVGDAFIARLDGDGNRLWVKQFGTPRVGLGNGAPGRRGRRRLRGWLHRG